MHMVVIVLKGLLKDCGLEWAREWGLEGGDPASGKLL